MQGWRISMEDAHACILDLQPLEEVERAHVLRVLAAVGDNRSEAARILRIGRNTLLRKLKDWGVE